MKLPTSPSGDPSQRHAALTVTALVVVLGIPATLTLWRVAEPGVLAVDFAVATPQGYTWSLLLFLVPILVLGGWFWRDPGRRLQKRALAWTLLIVVPTGFALDFLLASRLFEFPNVEATLKVPIPVLGPAGSTAPIEEFVFYLAGFLAVLLTYIWADEHWMAAYNIPDYSAYADKLDRVLSFHGLSLVIGAFLAVGAILYKRFLLGEAAFPTYFLYLVATGIVPSVGLYRSVRDAINWRAVSLVLTLITLVSLLWEVTLGVPYGWWDYQRGAMLGFFIGAWSHLPIEAVLVWLAVTYMTVIVYEAMKVWLASGMTWREAAAGRRR